MVNVRSIAAAFCLAILLSACAADDPVSLTADALTSDAMVESGTTASMSGKMVTRSIKGSVDPATVLSTGPQFCGPPDFCSDRCPNTDTPTWVIQFSGQGQATHLGKFVASAEHCSVVTFDPDTMIPVSAVYGDGEFEVVAANGDRFSGIYGRYGEGGDGASATVAPGVGDFHDMLVVMSGTGRFANASGMIQEDGLFSVATGAITHWTMHGELSYAASDRSSR